MSDAYQDALDQFIVDAEVAHNIIHGGAGQSIETESGPVKTLAEAIRQMGAQVAFPTSLVAASKYDSLNALAAAFTSVEVAVLLDDALGMVADLTLTSNIRLIDFGGHIDLNGHTLSIPQGITAGRHQIFAGVGNVTNLPEARPEWFGNNLSQAVPSTAHLMLTSGITYQVTGIVGAAIATLSNRAAYRITGAGATIQDTQTYTGTDTSILISFVSCSNVYVDPGITFTSQASNNIDLRGISWFKFTQGCNGIRGGGSFNGGLHGFYFQRNSSEPSSYISKNIDINIRAVGVYYPTLHERSGDIGVVRINADTCGRSFFSFGGGNNIDAYVVSKNQHGATLISSASGGEGVTNLNLNFYDRDSDFTDTVESAYVGLQFYNQTPAAFKNISISLNIKNPSTRTNKDSFSIFKFNNSGSVDVVGRGHVLDGLKLSGISEQVDTGDHIGMLGSFASPDVVSGLDITDFTCRGVTPGGSRLNLVLGNALQGILQVRGLQAPNAVVDITHTTGKTVFFNSIAQYMSHDASDTSEQDYISCNILSPAAQSRLKKYFDRTYMGSELYSNPMGYSVNTGSMAANSTQSLTINGIANQQGKVTLTRGGGIYAEFILQGANHSVIELVDPANAFSTTPGTLGYNVYWSATNSCYEIENKTGYTETYGVDITYYTRMD